jgi:hypothetical protein
MDRSRSYARIRALHPSSRHSQRHIDQRIREAPPPRRKTPRKREAPPPQRKTPHKREAAPPRRKTPRKRQKAARAAGLARAPQDLPLPTTVGANPKQTIRPSARQMATHTVRLKNPPPAKHKNQSAYNSTCIPISTTRFAGILKNFVLRVEFRAMNENTARRHRHSAGFLAATTVCRDRK